MATNSSVSLYQRRPNTSAAIRYIVLGCTFLFRLSVYWASLTDMRLKTDADHIVDISKRVQPGRNIVQLLRPLYPSPSVNYVFILRFHPPTPRQSAEVMKQRGNNLAWDKLLVWCAQIDIPELDYDIHGA